YLRMLDDGALPGEVANKIREGIWAQGSLKQVVQQYIRHFEMMDDLYLQERVVDIRDLGRRVLSHMQEGEHTHKEYPERTVLVSEELTPAMLGEVPKGQLVGLVSVKGSSNSHVAILARCMGVRSVMGLVAIPVNQLDGRGLVVDGFEGQSFDSAAAGLRASYQTICKVEG